MSLPDINTRTEITPAASLFADKSSKSCKFVVPAAGNLLDMTQEYGLDIEGARCWSAACSTCHAIAVDDTRYDRMPELEDDENDMLDLAFGLTDGYFPPPPGKNFE